MVCSLNCPYSSNTFSSETTEDSSMPLVASGTKSPTSMSTELPSVLASCVTSVLSPGIPSSGAEGCSSTTGGAGSSISGVDGVSSTTGGSGDGSSTSG